MVIGILVAIQINNWNEERKERQFETKMLQELASSTDTNIEYLNLGIKMTHDARNSCLILINHIENKLPYHDSLDAHFMYSLFWYKTLIDFSAYETIKTYGLQLSNRLH